MVLLQTSPGRRFWVHVVPYLVRSPFAVRRPRSHPVPRLAALYDIHGNLPALDAALADVAKSSVDRIVIGGDVIPGPMPRDCLERVLSLGMPTDFIHGNGERAVL